MLDLMDQPASASALTHQSTGRRGKTHLRRFVLGKLQQIWQVAEISKLQEAREANKWMTTPLPVATNYLAVKMSKMLNCAPTKRKHVLFVHCYNSQCRFSDSSAFKLIDTCIAEDAYNKKKPSTRGKRTRMQCLQSQAPTLPVT
jgi:hypothetical protein